MGIPNLVPGTKIKGCEENSVYSCINCISIFRKYCYYL